MLLKIAHRAAQSGKGGTAGRWCLVDKRHVVEPPNPRECLAEPCDEDRRKNSKNTQIELRACELEIAQKNYLSIEPVCSEIAQMYNSFIRPRIGLNHEVNGLDEGLK